MFVLCTNVECMCVLVFGFVHENGHSCNVCNIVNYFTYMNITKKH